MEHFAPGYEEPLLQKVDFVAPKIWFESSNRKEIIIRKFACRETDGLEIVRAFVGKLSFERVNVWKMSKKEGKIILFLVTYPKQATSQCHNRLVHQGFPPRVCKYRTFHLPSGWNSM